MTANEGIATHIKKFNQTQLSPSELPNISLLASLKALNQILASRKKRIESQFEARTHIEKIITYQEAKQLQQSKQRIRENEQMIKIIQICREIDITIVSFQDNIEAVDFDQFHRLRNRLTLFKTLYIELNKLDQQFNTLSKFYLQNHQNEENKNEKQYSKDCQNLKVEYLKNLKEKLRKGIVEMFYNKKRVRELQQSLQYFKLPIKKTANITSNSSMVEQKINYNKQDPKYLHFCYCIIQSLFSQYCYYCLQKKMQMIFEQSQYQQWKKQEGIIEGNDSEQQALALSYRNSQKQESQNQPKQYKSLFFQKIWHKVTQSLVYIFINSSSINNQNNIYQIDEPNWMFQYMEDIFRINYRFISENILNVIKNIPEIKQIIQYIQTYFIAYNIKYFFLKYIIIRLETDIKFIKQEQKPQKSQKRVSKQKKDRSAFIIFNFLDQLHLLSERIFDNFQYQSNLIQSVLHWAEKNSTLDLLSYCFDYEHNWIEQRIFGDFANINYSSITDLRNVEAYNITINFTHIFQKLYSKFRKVSDQSLKQKINMFYNEKLLQLVRHIKTSFERIYNYSEIDKYEILVSYKKIQDQFRGYFGQFIHQSPTFQQKIITQYYSVLEKYISVLALQKLTNIHKQMYKRLSDNNELFTKQDFQANQDTSINKNKKKWNQLFEDWKDKMNKISKLQPNYEDKKLRNIFFVFLQSIQFSQDGFYYFISVFEPFLIAIFSLQATNIIKVLLDMEKGALKQYCKSHQNTLWFLTSGQLKSIQKARIGKQKPNAI